MDHHDERAREFARKVAARKGWRLYPDETHIGGVLTGLAANARQHGYYLCPCRDGSGERTRDADIVCPCRYAEADVAEHGQCYCGLYVSPGFVGEGREVDAIPERRPPDREDGGPEAGG